MRIKNLLFLTLILLISFCSTIQFKKRLNELPSPGCVWIFESCDQSGKYKQFCSQDGKVRYEINDIVGSIKVGANTTWGLKVRGFFSRPSRNNQQPPCFMWNSN